MPALTGSVIAKGAPADNAYVQLQNLTGDFQAEVRTGATGKFVLHPVRGRWRLISWVPGGSRDEREVEVGQDDVDVEIALP
jgi:hypothetical protein